MKRIFTFGFLLLALGQGAAEAQQLLSLDSCRAMALRNNKQMGVQQLKQDIAANLRKSARTKYLPHVSAIGSYQFTSEEISILNNEQKGKLSNLGTNLTGSLSGLGNTLQTTLGQMGTMLGQLGVPAEAFQQMAGQLQQNMQQTSTNMAGLLDSEGQKIVDAFRTDTRHIFAGSVLVTQPIFMGGGIVALNKLAESFRFSDPVSSDALNDIEASLNALVDELQSAVLEKDNAAAQTLCAKVEATLADRNRMCKLNK